MANEVKSADELISLVEKWGIDRNITAEGGATVSKQISKLTEELAECFDAVGMLHHGKENAKFYLKDALGDMLVCIIQAARLVGFSTQECLQLAYDEIKDRRGVMVNGKFVKSE